MAVQQTRKSRSKRDMRRKANSKIASPTLSVDSMSGETHLRHHVSKKGFLRGRQVLVVKSAASADAE